MHSPRGRFPVQRRRSRRPRPCLSSSPDGRRRSCRRPLRRPTTSSSLLIDPSPKGKTAPPTRQETATGSTRQISRLHRLPFSPGSGPTSSGPSTRYKGMTTSQVDLLLSSRNSLQLAAHSRVVFPTCESIHRLEPQWRFDRQSPRHWPCPMSNADGRLTHVASQDEGPQAARRWRSRLVIASDI